MAFRNENHSNMLLFKNRLWKLMESKGIDTSEKLAKELLDNELVTVNSDDFDLQRYDYEGVVRKRLVNAVRRKIDVHLKSDDTEKLQAEYVNAYCQFFNCSADYLFGYIPYPLHQTTDMNNFTGLSEDIINKLHKLHITITLIGEDTEPITSLNEILSCNDFWNILDRVKEYKKIVADYKTATVNLKWAENGDLIASQIIEGLYGNRNEPTDCTKYTIECKKLLEKKEALEYRISTYFHDVMKEIEKM